MHILSHQARAGDGVSSSRTEPVPNRGITNDTSGKASSRHPISKLATLLRWLLLDIPLLVVFCMFLSALLFQHVYDDTVKPLVESYRRGEYDEDGYYSEFDFDMTYYNRQCGPEDISTRETKDLVITKDQTGEEAASVMMDHGAVVFKNVLSNETASGLRSYLESRNEVRDTLSWHENFWHEIGRLALGLGAHDDPIITQALHEVGTHPEIKKTIEGILGADPAIVEISTMTSMYGAKDQGIHSDSDYFGSSVLYARNFLHSYTMFMALQDTTSLMGATTICPGSHNCANIDLEEVCMAEGNSFEVSSNGYTGAEHGVFQKGDAMLFNQNIWHRGAANQDPENPINRVMFIITFISRNKDTPGDRRQQALGTYYYQRWNHWGHTYSDLKNVDWIMLQPFATLRALGIWKLSGAKWGITWIEHFARQLANDEDFYASYELEPFEDYLDTLGIPEFLQGKSREWEHFLESMTTNWVEFLKQVNMVGIGAYITMYTLLSGLVYMCSRSKSKSEDTPKASRKLWVPSIIKRLVFMYGGACLSFFLLSRYMDNTLLANKIKSGEAFIRPYSPPAQFDDGNVKVDTSASKAMVQDLKLGPTVFPERMDILIGTRFDAEWLGVYNHMLDFHPGNKRFQSLVAQVAGMPLSPKEATAKLLELSQDRIQAVAPRFLFQNPSDGYWTLMDDNQLSEIAHKTLVAEKNKLTNSLWICLREILADGRFGTLRNTKMAQQFTPKFVLKWEAIIFEGMPKYEAKAEVRAIPGIVQAIQKKRLSIDKRMNVQEQTSRRLRQPSPKRIASTETDSKLKVGDRVVANYDRSGSWLDGTIARVYTSDRCLVAFANGQYANLTNESVQKYKPHKQGDKVEAFHDSGEWFPATIADIHPLGMYGVAYDDGDSGTVDVDFLRYAAFKQVSFVVDSEVTQKTVLQDRMEEDDEDDDDDDEEDFLEIGTRVYCNFYGRGQWFDGVISDEADDGTYSVDFDDGDEEHGVPLDRIEPMS